MPEFGNKDRVVLTDPNDDYKPIGVSGKPLVTSDESTDASNRVTRIESQCDYETVAASATDQVLGVTGGVGDWLHCLWAVPATTSPGAVTLKDGASGAITLFAGGATSVADLKPFKLAIPQDGVSTNGAWKVTTGLNISVIASGRFKP